MRNRSSLFFGGRIFILMIAGCLVVLLPATRSRASEILDQIISREDPSFICADAKMQVGLDGMVYFASHVGETSCGLRIDREGHDKLTGALLPSPEAIIANAQGLIGVANCHFQKTIAIYDRQWGPLAKQSDFRIGDDVGFDAPGDVQAGESGDFYGLDQHRSRILRISPTGKIVAVCTLPPNSATKEQVAQFRVCEKLHTLYIQYRYSGAWRAIGFDGTAGAELKVNSSLFQVDPTGSLLYVLPNHKPVIEIYSPDGKLQKQIALAKNDRMPTGEQWFNAMGIFGNDLILRRPDARELFQVYDLTTGAFKRGVDIRHERLTVTLDTLVWNAGQKISFPIAFHGLDPAAHPKWRIWLRPFESTDYRELTLADDKITVPDDLAGIYVLKVTPEVEPRQAAVASEYGVHALVEIRKADARGSVSVGTTDNRTHFGRGMDIPFTITARSPDSIHDLPVIVRLLDESKEIGRVSVKLGADPAAMMIPARVTAGLVPGRYWLVPTAAGMNCIFQPIIIGADLVNPPFSITEYADYGTLSPATPSVFVAPDVVAADALRRERLGENLIVDRLGAGINLSYIHWPREELETLNPLIQRLEKDPASPPAAKVRTASPLLQTMAQYSAGGIQEMPILMANDAGLPLGTGFDNRKPPELEKSIRTITDAMLPTGVMRGWIWSSNWWNFDKAGANAANSPDERTAYEAAFKEADKTGQWAAVLDTVSDRRLNYAVDAQAMFNDVLKKIAPGMVRAVAAPYRNVNAYPPITFSNVDEVDLHIQWEQMAVPYTEPYNVDFYARPGKRAWAHPEVWNDDGTGGQILPNLFLSIMRGSDGVGVSGELPGWQFPDDPRNCMNYTESVHRQLNAFLQKYGPWLTTLRSDDNIAIVADGRMFKLDDWRGNFGMHFARLFETYITCLHAHRSPHVVFVEDMSPQTLTNYKAVLLIDQRVEMEPKLVEALANAKTAGIPIFCDGTCRPRLVDGFTPLGLSFDHLEKDPSSAGDDAANWRFSNYARADLPALLKTLGQVVPPIADAPNEEVFVSQRKAGAGRYLFVVNHTTPQLDPGQLWRTNLSVSTFVPLQVSVKPSADGAAVYEVLAMRQVAADKGVVNADLRLAPARIFAVLPAAIDQVSLSGPQTCPAGAGFSWSASVLDAKAQPIDASVPLRVQLIGADGRILNERFVAGDLHGAQGVFTAPLNAPKGDLTLQATELLSGRSAKLFIVTAPAPASPLMVSADVPAGESSKTVAPAAAGASTRGGAVATDLSPAELSFGPHIRDIISANNDSLVVMNAFNWDNNLYALDAATGQLRWRERVGQYFTFSPQALGAGLAVQGFDFQSAEGYQLYLLNADGAAERRFSLYGLPKRLPHRFVPGYFSFEDGKPIDNFAAAADGSWIACAGDLGLVVWDRGGKVLWQQDWWKTNRHVAVLAALNAKTLLAVDGMQVTAYQAGTGQELWRTTLALTGKCQQIRVAGDGRRLVVLASTDGGTVFVLGADGKLIADFPSLDASEIAATADGRTIVTVAQSQCRLYSLPGGLQWVFNGDDRLRSPRFAPDDKHLTFASDLGSVYVLDRQGAVLFNDDQGSRSTPAWMSNGDLLIGSWTGQARRLGANFRERWRTHLSPDDQDLHGRFLARDTTPTARLGSWGNAAPVPLSISPNLLAQTKADIRLVTASNEEWTQSDEAVARLYDGKATPPEQPWIPWYLISQFAEQTRFNYLKIETQHTLLHVTAITLFEDAAHPESWLRDAQLDYWNAAAEQWIPIMPLLSDAAIHTHVFPQPVEAVRFRIVLPDGLYGNLRLAQIVFHGDALGCSHPDVVARRPVAVLFDEQDELKDCMVGHDGLSFDFKNPFSGGRCLALEADHSAAPRWERGFHERIPNWDFEIVENPKPGQYRWLQFAWRALSPQTKGITLAIADQRFAAGVVSTKGDWGGRIVPLADSPPTEWKVMRVDLWKAVGKETRINKMWLGCVGGPAAFDQILLGKSEKDLQDYRVPGSK